MIQKKKFATLLFFVLAIGALVFFRDTAAVRGAGGFLLRTASPFMEWTQGVRKIGGAFFSDVSESDLIALREENIRLRALAFKAEDLQKEAGEFRAALRFREESRFPAVSARVLTYRKEFGGEFLIIRAGSGEGVQRGNIAVSAEGLFLGTVKEVDQDFSKVTIASNPDSTFDVEILPSGTGALARGLGARAFAVELIPRGIPVSRGDFVFLSARGVRLPLGMIVGVDESDSLAFQEGRATLLVDPRGIGMVSVLLATP